MKSNKHLQFALVTCLFLFVVIIPARSQDEVGTSEEISDRLRVTKVDIDRLKERRAMISDIQSAVVELENIQNGTSYQPNVPLLTEIETLLNTIETTADPDVKLTDARTLYQKIKAVIRLNLDTYVDLQTKLTELKKFEDTPTENQRFRDNKLQQLRQRIKSQINGDKYKGRWPDIPVIWFSSSANVVNIDSHVDAELIDKLRELSSQSDFNLLSDIYTSSMTEFKDELDLLDKQLQTEIKDLTELYEKQFEIVQERRTTIDKQLLWTIPIYGGIVLLILLIPLAYRKYPELSVQFGDYRILLEVITVFMLLVVILLLGVAERIEQEALGPLLGSLAGYILGRNIPRKSNNKHDPNLGADT